MNPQKYAHVKFHPWVGQRYWDEVRWGFRAMVLGESHYGGNEERAAFTIKVIGDVVNGLDIGWRTRLFTKTARLFQLAAEDKRADRDECRDFWQDVLFYNYIQDYIAGPRIPPTSEVWESSRAAFDEVVEIHCPELILVLGKRLGDHFKLHVQCKKRIFLAFKSTILNPEDGNTKPGCCI